MNVIIDSLTRRQSRQLIARQILTAFNAMLRHSLRVCIVLIVHFFALKALAAQSGQTVLPIRSDRQIADIILDRAHAFRLSKTPLICEVGFDLIDLIRVDEAKETYTINFYAWVVWQDERLAFQQSEFGIERVNISPSVAWDNDRLWNPHIEFMNVVETKVMEESLRFEASGNCRYTVRQTGTFKFAGGTNSFRRFPFDQQDLPITLSSFQWDRDHVRFEIQGGERTYAKDEFAKLRSAECEILGVRTQISEEKYVGDPAPFSMAAIIVTIKRDPGFYLWRICLPLLILVVIAMSVAWLPHRHLESRLILSVTTLVAVTTFSIFVNTDLPKLPYLTTIDVWMLVSFVLSAFGAIENVIVSSLAHGGSVSASQKIDYHSRWLLPLLYLISTILCLLR